MTTLRMTYYPDITQKQTGEDVRNAILAFAESLAVQLSADLGTKIVVEVPPVRPVTEQYRNILHGETHIALMRPVAYVLAHQENEQILPVCVAHRPIDGKVGTTYYAQLYARRDLEIGSLAELARRSAGIHTIAYGDRFSTSNFLIPASMLRLHAGIHPFLFFKSVLFTGGHDLAAEAVYRGDADIGAGHDGVIKILSKEFPDAEKRIVRLAREDIHSDPVVVHSGILPGSVSVEALQQACTTVAKTEPVKAALDLFWGGVKDLGPTEHTNYALIEHAIEALHLTENDMLC